LETSAAAVAARQQQQTAAWEAQEQDSGTHKRGFKLKIPDPIVDPDAVANLTNLDSGIMKMREGSVQGYTAQALVTPD
jgi:hypothetical protein